MDTCTLAIDQGTHSTRALVFDGQGRSLALARQPVDIQRISLSEVEQDPAQILQSVRDVIDAVLAAPQLIGRQVTAAGLATQRSSVVAWRRDTGDALSALLSWQDRRSAAYLESLSGQAPAVSRRTGLPLSPHYGAGKLHWLLHNNGAVTAAARRGQLLMGPLASYLLFQLLVNRPAVVDHANASRTLLWNLYTRDWDPDQLALFGIARNLLPDCRPVRSAYGTLSGSGIPLTAVNGDQTAALYAAGAAPPGELLVNVGTGAFVLLPIADIAERPDGLLAGTAMSSDDSAQYYIEGTVNGAAAALTWAASRFAFGDLRAQLPRWLNDIRDPALFINSVGGLGAPWWKDGPEPYFQPADIAAPEAAVAIVESIVFLLQAIIMRLHSLPVELRAIRISGGLANLDGLCQRLADLSGLPVRRPQQTEATARGIAWQAAGCPAHWAPAWQTAGFRPQDNTALQDRYQRFIAVIDSL